LAVIFLLVLVLISCGFSRTILQGKGAVTSQAWSLDGKVLAVGDENRVILFWDIARCVPIQTLQAPSSITALAWSPDGRSLAAAWWSQTDESTLATWDARSGVLLETVPIATPELRTLAWSPDGNTLAAGMQDEMVILWQPASGLVTNPGELPASITGLAWSPDGRSIAVGLENGSILLWDVSSKELANTLSYSPDYYIADLPWSPDASRLAEASCFTGPTLPENCSLVIWNLTNGEPLHAMRTGIYDFTNISWSPNGSIIASAMMNGDVILYDADRNIRVQTLRTPMGWTVVSWSPDGNELAAGSNDGSIILWKGVP
jgi:WD40 repeat protein